MTDNDICGARGCYNREIFVLYCTVSLCLAHWYLECKQEEDWVMAKDKEGIPETIKLKRGRNFVGLKLRDINIRSVEFEEIMCVSDNIDITTHIDDRPNKPINDMDIDEIWDILNF